MEFLVLWRCKKGRSYFVKAGDTRWADVQRHVNNFFSMALIVSECPFSWMTHYTEDQLTMKKFRNWITFAVVLAMVLSLAVGVSANSSSVMDGHYGTISGTSYQNSTSPATLYTSSRMSKNPDSARFVIKVEYNDGENYLTALSQNSSRGITSFTYTFPI